jgi:hypothetical protein
MKVSYFSKIDYLCEFAISISTVFSKKMHFAWLDFLKANNGAFVSIFLILDESKIETEPLL